MELSSGTWLHVGGKVSGEDGRLGQLAVICCEVEIENALHDKIPGPRSFLVRHPAGPPLV